VTGKLCEPRCLIVYIPEPGHASMHTTRRKGCHVTGKVR